MLNKFQKYYQKNELFSITDKILLTISGGKDSMAMLYLFKENELSFGVAHCNFQLRGKDAEKDEQFVREFCKNNNIEFHTKRFQTKEYATENGISIQMAARDLRYSWFEKIKLEYNYQFISTAHHKNDVAETILINLTKGTGLAGLHGISNKKGGVIRPLLCFNSSEIKKYVKENKISYREDISNSDTKYTRNSIRHNVITQLEKINPNFIETANDEADHFFELEQILNQKIEEEKKELFIKTKDGFQLEITPLKKLKPLKTYLYYFLKDYSFNAADVLDIINGLDGQSGQIFYSSTHQIVKDRDYLLLSRVVENNSEIVVINSEKEFPFDSEIIQISSDFKVERDASYACLDIDKLRFPLTLRTWEKGDVFQPLGMKGSKKVSDFLIDNKISIVDKQTIKVMISCDDIVWLVGKRISDKFKITSTTKKGLILFQKD